MTPEEKEAQRNRGLALANAVRTRRAELKRELATGATKLSIVLRDDEKFLRTMKVRELLLAVPSLGPEKVRVILHSQQISPTRTLVNLSQRRREELLARIASGGRVIRERI